MGKLTMSQVDPAVFAELPPEVAAELAAALPPSHASFFSVGNIPPDPGSPLPSGTDAEAAAQHDPKVRAAAKVLLTSLLSFQLPYHGPMLYISVKMYVSASPKSYVSAAQRRSGHLHGPSAVKSSWTSQLSAMASML